MSLARYARGLARVKPQSPGTTPGGIGIALPTTRPAGQIEEWWPAECLESARRFGHPDGLLYPLLRGPVQTPQGIGLLQQVLGGFAVVEFEGLATVKRFAVGAIRPVGPASKELDR